MNTRAPRLLIAFLLALSIGGVALIIALRAESLRAPCRLLPQEYCRSGVPVYYGSTLVGLGFTLPAGTPVYAPFEGVFRYAPVRAYEGVEVWRGIVEVVPRSPLDEEAFRMVTIGALTPQTALNTSVPAGTRIGSVSGEPLTVFGGVTFVVSFERYSAAARFFTQDPALFSEIFPSLSLPDSSGR